MKALFIAYNQAYGDEIVQILEAQGQRGFTVTVVTLTSASRKNGQRRKKARRNVLRMMIFVDG